MSRSFVCCDCEFANQILRCIWERARCVVSRCFDVRNCLGLASVPLLSGNISLTYQRYIWVAKFLFWAYAPWFRNPTRLGRCIRCSKGGSRETQRFVYNINGYSCEAVLLVLIHLLRWGCPSYGRKTDSSEPYRKILVLPNWTNAASMEALHDPNRHHACVRTILRKLMLACEWKREECCSMFCSSGLHCRSTWKPHIV